MITFSDHKKPRRGMLFKRLLFHPQLVGGGSCSRPGTMNSRVIGTIDLDVDTNTKTVFINFVEVDKHWQGHGVARKMLTAVFKEQPALVVFGTFTELGEQRLRPMVLELSKTHNVLTDL